MSGPERTRDRSAILARFAEYIATNDIPIIAEFSAREGFHKAILYRWEEAQELLGLCITKKEAALERGLLEGKLVPSGAIFSLKQLGWKDRVEHSGDENAPIALVLKGSDIRG